MDGGRFDDDEEFPGTSIKDTELEGGRTDGHTYKRAQVALNNISFFSPEFLPSFSCCCTVTEHDHDVRSVRWGFGLSLTRSFARPIAPHRKKGQIARAKSAFLWAVWLASRIRRRRRSLARRAEGGAGEKTEKKMESSARTYWYGWRREGRGGTILSTDPSPRARPAAGRPSTIGGGSVVGGGRRAASDVAKRLTHPLLLIPSRRRPPQPPPSEYNHRFSSLYLTAATE